MKKLVFLFLFVFLVSCKAQTEINTIPWKEFISKEAGFKADLPCEPTKDIRSNDYIAGKRFGYTFQCEYEGMKFLILYGDHNPDIEQDKKVFLKNAEDELLVSIGSKGKVLKREELQVEGFPARLFIIEFGDNKKSQALIVVSDKGSLNAMFAPPLNTSSTDVNRNFDSVGKKFLDSFQIIENK